jgi:hypothetical protein
MQGGAMKRSDAPKKVPGVDKRVKNILSQQNKKKQLMDSFTGETPTLKRIKSNIKKKKPRSIV